jgi:hypothetical protein
MAGGMLLKGLNRKIAAHAKKGNIDGLIVLNRRPGKG